MKKLTLLAVALLLITALPGIAQQGDLLAGSDEIEALFGRALIRTGDTGVLVAFDDAERGGLDGVADLVFLYQLPGAPAELIDLDLGDAVLFVRHDQVTVISQNGPEVVELTLAGDDRQQGLAIAGDGATYRLGNGYGLARYRPVGLNLDELAQRSLDSLTAGDLVSPEGHELGALMERAQVIGGGGGGNCAAGGPGSSSCSVSTCCSVSCRDGYYACCHCTNGCNCVAEGGGSGGISPEIFNQR